MKVHQGLLNTKTQSPIQIRDANLRKSLMVQLPAESSVPGKAPADACSVSVPASESAAGQ